MEQKAHSPREVFLHLLSMVTLYMSAFAFGQLWFNYIEKYFPDVLEIGGYAVPDSIGNDAIRWSIASLIIVFPAYFFVTRFLRRLYNRDPAQAGRRIRKWLVYLTLFLAAAAIISDLVTLVYHLLGGEITARFVLKVFAVLFIAGAIFGYYFWELREFREEGEGSTVPHNARTTRVFVSVVVAVMAGSVVAGFFVVGSPQRERLARFDERRVNDLQIIQNETVNFWQTKDRLPANLEELKNDLSGFVAPRDPETGAAYEYRALEPLRFELCANFATGSRNAAEVTDRTDRRVKSAMPYPVFSYDGMGNWMHGLGRECFIRTIDPERLRPAAPIKM